jgi:hypothetical protein
MRHGRRRRWRDLRSDRPRLALCFRRPCTIYRRFGDILLAEKAALWDTKGRTHSKRVYFNGNCQSAPLFCSMPFDNVIDAVTPVACAMLGPNLAACCRLSLLIMYAGVSSILLHVPHPLSIRPNHTISHRYVTCRRKIPWSWPRCATLHCPPLADHSAQPSCPLKKLRYIFNQMWRCLKVSDHLPLLNQSFLLNTYKSKAQQHPQPST